MTWPLPFGIPPKRNRVLATRAYPLMRRTPGQVLSLAYTSRNCMEILLTKHSSSIPASLLLGA